jgi:hypothetical protein
MTTLAVDAITAFSVKPLRIAFYVGCASALLSVFYLAFIFSQLVAGGTVEGWTSLMVVLLFLGAPQLVTLGIIGEYIGRIYDQTRGRPRYLVKPDKTDDSTRCGAGLSGAGVRSATRFLATPGTHPTSVSAACHGDRSVRIASGNACEPSDETDAGHARSNRYSRC